MVKHLAIAPEEVRQSETIDLGKIPVNLYHETPADELRSRRLRVEDLFFPQPGWLLDVIRTCLMPLRGYRPRTAGRSRRDCANIGWTCEV